MEPVTSAGGGKLNERVQKKGLRLKFKGAKTQMLLVERTFFAVWSYICPILVTVRGGPIVTARSGPMQVSLHRAPFIRSHFLLYFPYTQIDKTGRIRDRRFISVIEAGRGFTTPSDTDQDNAPSEEAGKQIGSVDSQLAAASPRGKSTQRVRPQKEINERDYGLGSRWGTGCPFLAVARVVSSDKLIISSENVNVRVAFGREGWITSNVFPLNWN